jgi:ankyrin repeat protein
LSIGQIQTGLQNSLFSFFFELNHSRETPLHYAMMSARTASITTITWLIEKGASLDIRSIRGLTAIEYLDQCATPRKYFCVSFSPS